MQASVLALVIVGIAIAVINIFFICWIAKFLYTTPEQLRRIAAALEAIAYEDEEEA